MERIITTGPGGGVQPRLEINTLVQDDRFFSLYIQALSPPLSCRIISAALTYIYT